MKKNVMMRIASILLVCVLATTCGISGTFAKYVTTGSAADNARVAKWGVTISATDGAFSKSYPLEDTLKTQAQITNSVEDDADKLVAPGTSGAFADITVTGTAEVAVRVTYNATVILSDWIINADEYYCPIVVTVGNTAINGLAYDDADDFAAAIKEAIDGVQEYAPGAPVAQTLEVSWAWAFEVDGDQAAKDAANAKDTKLGEKGTDSISITINVTAEQIN